MKKSKKLKDKVQGWTLFEIVKKMVKKELKKEYENQKNGIEVLFSKVFLTLTKLTKHLCRVIPLSTAYLALSIHGFEKSVARRILKIFKQAGLITISTRGLKINFEKFERIIQTKNKELEKELGRRKVEKLISYIKKAKIACLI